MNLIQITNGNCYVYTGNIDRYSRELYIRNKGNWGLQDTFPYFLFSLDGFCLLMIWSNANIINEYGADFETLLIHLESDKQCLWLDKKPEK